MRRSLVGATAALLLGVVALLGASSFASSGAVVAFRYHPAATLAAWSYLADAVTPPELGQRTPSARVAAPTDRYDDASQVARASARPASYRSAPNTTGSGHVVFNRPRAGSTAAQDAQIRACVDGCNAARCAGALSPTGRVSTQGSLQQQAGRAAAAERSANPGAYGPRQHAGHVPDTTWTGSPNPHSWMALDESINTSLGAQAGLYPIGYQPTGFWFIDDYIAQFGGPP